MTALKQARETVKTLTEALAQAKALVKSLENPPKTVALDGDPPERALMALADDGLIDMSPFMG